MKVVSVSLLILFTADLGVLAQVPAAPADLGVTCDGTAADFCASGFEKCRTACQAAACCGDEDASKNCLGDNIQSCTTYGPCSSLRASFCEDIDEFVLPDPPQNIATICDSTVADFCTTTAAAECAKACTPAACCAATDESSCLAANGPKCFGYAICTGLTACGDPPTTTTEEEEAEENMGGNSEVDATSEVSSAQKTTGMRAVVIAILATFSPSML